MATRVASATPTLDASAAELTKLQALCSELRQQGYTALVVEYSNCGDTDDRLLASCPGAPIVELLGPYNAIPDHVWWHAVRLDPQNRSIWRGPPKGCTRSRVIDFVTNLLTQPPQRLTRRYQAL